MGHHPFSGGQQAARVQLAVSDAAGRHAACLERLRDIVTWLQDAERGPDPRRVETRQRVQEQGRATPRHQMIAQEGDVERRAHRGLGAHISCSILRHRGRPDARGFGKVQAMPEQTKLRKLWSRVSDRLLDFQPYVRTLEIDGAPIRFFHATAQAADWYDPFKPRNRRELEWLLANLPLQGQKIIDAGAFHGLYTTVFAKAAGERGEVVAVDPVASNQAVIEVNLAINGLHGRIEGCAVSNAEGEVGFSRASCGHIVARGGLRCPSRRLRSIMPEATVVKLDIEGAEFGVVPAQIDELPGALAWIVEIHPGKGRRPDDVIEPFRARGFGLWWNEPAAGEIKPYAGELWSARTTLIALRRS